MDFELREKAAMYVLFAELRRPTEQDIHIACCNTDDLYIKSKRNMLLVLSRF